MIKIRYRDLTALSPGLHAAAERHGRCTTVYLLSGLTPVQRRAALRRLRLSARMGHCPRLPAAQLAFALLADRVRTVLAQAAAVFRLHPAGTVLPVVMAGGCVLAFLALSAVPGRVTASAQGPAHRSAQAAPAAPPSSAPVAGPSPDPGPSARQPASDTGRVTAAWAGPLPPSPPGTGPPDTGPPPASPGSGGPGTGPPGTPGTPSAVPDPGAAVGSPPPRRGPPPQPPATPDLLLPDRPPPAGAGGCPAAELADLCSDG